MAIGPLKQLSRTSEVQLTYADARPPIISRPFAIQSDGGQADPDTDEKLSLRCQERQGVLDFVPLRLRVRLICRGPSTEDQNTQIPPVSGPPSPVHLTPKQLTSTRNLQPGTRNLKLPPDQQTNQKNVELLSTFTGFIKRAQIIINICFESVEIV